MEDHEEHLIMEEPAELHCEHQKMLVRSFPLRKSRQEASSDGLKSIMEKWNDYHYFFEKHPSVTVMKIMFNLKHLMKDNVSHF